MAEPAVGTRLDKLVIFAEGSGIAPLFAEVARCEPDKSDRGRREDNGSDQ